MDTVASYLSQKHKFNYHLKDINFSPYHPQINPHTLMWPYTKISFFFLRFHLNRKNLNHLPKNSATLNLFCIPYKHLQVFKYLDSACLNKFYSSHLNIFATKLYFHTFPIRNCLSKGLKEQAKIIKKSPGGKPTAINSSRSPFLGSYCFCLFFFFCCPF